MPTKQKKFSPPLAKNRSPGPTTGPISANNSPGTRTSKPEERAAIIARARAQQAAKLKGEDDSMDEGVQVFRSAAKSGGAAAPTNMKRDESRSSSPPAGVDDSFTSGDFDFDDEELERACSMYD